MKRVACDDAGLEAVATVLEAGGLAVIPTDTVYGLAAHPARPDALEKIYEAKGRDKRKPVALLAASVAAVEAAGFPLSGEARRLADEGWPGALTLVIGEEGHTEGFRVPDHAWTRRLAERCGGLLRVTSANLSGRPDATDADAAAAALAPFAAIAADGGPSRVGRPSRVVRVLPEGSVRILRA